SAGIAPNKYLAKIASDWRKPNGQFVVPPHRVEAFLTPLPVGKLPGVGKGTHGKLAALGVTNVGDLRRLPQASLRNQFGRWGTRLYELARGIDERPVQARRASLQVSTEDTFSTDLTLAALEAPIRELADKTWASMQRKHDKIARTVVLKLKTAEFQTLTRSLTPATSPGSARVLADIACGLRARVQLPDTTRYRLAGVALTGFVARAQVGEQARLFD